MNRYIKDIFTGEWKWTEDEPKVERVDRRASSFPVVWRDPYQHKPYISPLSGKEVSSRAERREEMKVHDVREVEPSEGPHRDRSRYSNPEFIRKHGIRIEE